MSKSNVDPVQPKDIQNILGFSSRSIVVDEMKVRTEEGKVNEHEKWVQPIYRLLKKPPS